MGGRDEKYNTGRGREREREIQAGNTVFLIYSWIGVQVGYMQSTLKTAQCQECGDGPRLIDDPFVLVVQSIRKSTDNEIHNNL